MYAGVSNMIYSLWKIGDKNTHHLMVKFYNSYLSGAGYAEALQKAKLELIKKPEMAFPKSWAGMVLVGN
jgi:CHAT domain-containing protein